MLSIGDQSSTGSVITSKKYKPPMNMELTNAPISSTKHGYVAQKKPNLSFEII